MKIALLLISLLISGCTTVVPVTQKFPEPPGVLAQQPCVNLQKLPDDPKLSQVATTVVNNYSEYYICAVKLEAWQRWYQEQKVLYERLK